MCTINFGIVQTHIQSIFVVHVILVLTACKMCGLSPEIPHCLLLFEKIMQLLSYNYTRKISLCFHFWLFLFFVMAYQFTELFAFPCCRSFWDFPSTICLKFLKPLSRIIQCLCSFSDNSGNHYLKTITLIIFPIFHMYCYVKLLKDFIRVSSSYFHICFWKPDFSPIVFPLSGI